MAVMDEVLSVVEGPFKATLFQDSDTESPRTWSNMSTMVCWHARYNLGDLQPKSGPDQWWEDAAKRVNGAAQATALATWNEGFHLASGQHGFGTPGYQGMRDRIDTAYRQACREIFEREHVVVDLYLMDHSGISISTTPFGDPWDSGQVGFAYIRLPDLTFEHHGLTDPTPEQVREWAVKVIEGEVAAYDMYLQGDVYGYVIEDAGGEQVDSLWGLYGSEYAEKAMREALAEQVKTLNEAADELVDSLRKGVGGEEADGAEVTVRTIRRLESYFSETGDYELHAVIVGNDVVAYFPAPENAQDYADSLKDVVTRD